MNLRIMILALYLFNTTFIVKAAEISDKEIYAKDLEAQNLYKKYTDDLLNLEQEFTKCFESHRDFGNHGPIKDLYGNEVKNITPKDVSKIRINDGCITFTGKYGCFVIVFKKIGDKKIVTKVKHECCIAW